jgi:hypothetical protein
MEPKAVFAPVAAAARQVLAFDGMGVNVSEGLAPEEITNVA